MPAHTGIGALTPHEITFLAETHAVTIIPRARLAALPLITSPTPALLPPRRTPVPLWLALLLKRQRRCNIVPPPWLTAQNIETIYKWELEHAEFSAALPWHWLETAELLLEVAADDIPDANIGGERDLRVLLRGLREVRQTKAREGLRQLESTYLQMNGLGIMEITELRGFAAGVMDGLRRLGREREMERRAAERAGGMVEDDDELESTVRGSSVVGSVAGRSAGTRTTGSGTAGRSSVAVRGSTWEEEEEDEF